MNMMANRTLAAALAVSAWACAGSQPAGPLEPVGVEVDRLFPTIEGMDEVSVKAKLVLSNPREVPATLVSIEYTITPEGDLGPVSGQLEAQQPIAPGQSLSTQVAESITLPIGSETYLQLVQLDTMPVVLEGVARFEDGTTTSFRKNGAIAFPNVPQLIVFESQAAKYGDEGLDVTFYLRLTNENPFGTVVDTASYEVLLDGKMVREGTAGIGVRLPQGSVQEYEVNTSIDASTFGADYRKYLEMDSFPYVVRGSVVVSGMKVPFSHEGTIELD